MGEEHLLVVHQLRLGKSVRSVTVAVGGSLADEWANEANPYDSQLDERSIQNDRTTKGTL